VSSQLRGLCAFEAAVCEPSPHKGLDCMMVSFRNVMITLESFDQFKRALRGRVVRVTQSWKQAVFLIGRTLRRGGCKIDQRRLELSRLRRRQQSPSSPACHRDENAEEILDAAVAVAEQAQRFGEVVVWRSANPDRHRRRALSIVCGRTSLRQRNQAQRHIELLDGDPDH
jgi:hypothetical protein